MAPKKKLAKIDTPPKKYTLRGRNAVPEKTESQPIVSSTASLPVAAKTNSVPAVSKPKQLEAKKSRAEPAKQPEPKESRKRRNSTPPEASEASTDQSDTSVSPSPVIQTATVAAKAKQGATASSQDSTKKEAKKDQLEAKMETVLGKVDGLSDQITSLEAILSSTKSELTSISTKVDLVIQKMEEEHEAKKELKRNSDATAAANIHTATVAKEDAKISEIQEKMNLVVEMVKLVNDAVKTTSATVAKEKAKRLEMEENVDVAFGEAYEQVSELTDTVDQMKDKMEQQDKEQKQLNNSLEGLVSLVEKLSASIIKNAELVDQNARSAASSMNLLSQKMAQQDLAELEMRATVAAAVSQMKTELKVKEQAEAKKPMEGPIPVAAEGLMNRTQDADPVEISGPGENGRPADASCVDLTPLNQTGAIDTSQGPIPVAYAKPFATLEIETPKVWRKTKTRSGMTMDTSRIPSPVYGSDESMESNPKEEEVKQTDSEVVQNGSSENAKPAPNLEQKETTVANNNEVTGIPSPATSKKSIMKLGKEREQGQITAQRQSSRVTFANYTPIEQDKNASSLDSPDEPDRAKRIPLACHKDSVKITRKRTGSSIGSGCVTTQDTTSESIGPAIKFKRPLQPADLLSNSPVFDSDGNFIPTSQRGSCIGNTRSTNSEGSNGAAAAENQESPKTESEASLANERSSFTIGDTEELGGTLLVEKTINITESPSQKSFVAAPGTSKDNAKGETSIICLDRTNMSPSSKTIDLITDGLNTPYGPK